MCLWRSMVLMEPLLLSLGDNVGVVASQRLTADLVTGTWCVMHCGEMLGTCCSVVVVVVKECNVFEWLVGVVTIWMVTRKLSSHGSQTACVWAEVD